MNGNLLDPLIEPHGFLFIDKPQGDSSTSIVAIVKRYLYSLGIKNLKVGHAGTLDPFAEGVLPVAIGEATKVIDYVMNISKTYDFSIQFGLETDTYDNTGLITNTCDYTPTEESINAVLPYFTGVLDQTPPKFSAIKISGQRAYALARSNQEFKIPSRKIKIYSLDLLNYNIKDKTATFRAEVGKGTYIRSLGVDIAKKLGSLGHISYLRRVRYALNKEIVLIPKNIQYNFKEYLISIEDMLDDILAYPLNRSQAVLLFNGNLQINNDFFTINKSNYRLIKATYNNKLVALLKMENNILSIVRVFNHHKKNITEGVI